MYSQRVLELFYNPTNYGVIKGAHGVGKIVDDTCDEILKIYITVQNGKVVESQFQAHGSPALISATGVAASLMVGKTLEDCNTITSAQILEGLGGVLPNNKKYVIALAESVIKSAVSNYYKKQGGAYDEED